MKTEVGNGCPSSCDSSVIADGVSYHATTYEPVSVALNEAEDVIIIAEIESVLIRQLELATGAVTTILTGDVDNSAK